MKFLSIFLIVFLQTIFCRKNHEGDQFERSTKFLKTLQTAAETNKNELQKLFRDDFKFNDCGQVLEREQILEHILIDSKFNFVFGNIRNESRSQRIYFDVDIQSEKCRFVEKLNFGIVRIFDISTNSHNYVAESGKALQCS
ncbi:unnamed protein product [Caenorhabditis angaria]|uniref:NTF2-like domain-containing protein n=1 Tax=Caenorhabditis angaria TaxID=860376 RepID=A0A9P1IE38_9PELO|nr:unnamed protein product [Caenorhabditis angaria]